MVSKYTVSHEAPYIKINFLIWWLYCDYRGYSPLCKKYEPKYLRMMEHDVGNLFPKCLGEKFLGNILATFSVSLKLFQTKKLKYITYILLPIFFFLFADHRVGSPNTGYHSEEVVCGRFCRRSSRQKRCALMEIFFSISLFTIKSCRLITHY